MDDTKMPRYEITEENVREAAVSTILNVWVCIDWDKVDKRRLPGIWDEVTSKVKAAATTTSSYEKFVDELCRKLDVRSLAHKEIVEIVGQTDEFKKAVMKMLREETQIVMLKVKVNNEIRKEQAKLLKEKDDREKRENGRLNGQSVKFTGDGARAV